MLVISGFTITVGHLVSTRRAKTPKRPHGDRL